MSSPTVQDRIVAFEDVLLDWLAEARLGVPLLTTLESEDIRAGRCVSCGIAVESGRWRCDECRTAVEWVLREFGR